jgi:hypothetical protein
MVTWLHSFNVALTCGSKVVQKWFNAVQYGSKVVQRGSEVVQYGSKVVQKLFNMVPSGSTWFNMAIQQALADRKTTFEPSLNHVEPH